MRMRAFLFLAGVWAMTLSPVHGQLYLIQGSATPKYNSGYQATLLQVGGTGALRAISEILPGDGRSGGT